MHCKCQLSPESHDSYLWFSIDCVKPRSISNHNMLLMDTFFTNVWSPFLNIFITFKSLKNMSEKNQLPLFIVTKY